MSGASYAGVAWVDDYGEYDDRYIQKAVLTLPGDIITLNNITQEPESLPAGPDGWVLSADSGNALGLQWIAPPSEEIDPAVPGANTGGSGLTILEPSPGVTQLAVCLSGVTAGAYGTGSAVPVITVNGQGIVTNLATTPVVASSLASIPIRNTKGGDLSVVGVQENCAFGYASQALTSGSCAYGAFSEARSSLSTAFGWQAITGAGSNNSAALGAQSQTTGPNQLALGTQCICTSPTNGGIAIGTGVFAGADTLAIAGYADQARNTVCGHLTLSQAADTSLYGYNIRTGPGSIQSIFLGREIGSYNITGIQNVFVGQFISQTVLTTGVSNTFLGSNINVANSAVSNALALGAGITNVASNSISAGLLASASANAAISLGQSSSASGIDSLSICRNSSASGQFSMAFGQGAVASAVRAYTFGQGLTNNNANTTLSGFDTAHISRFTGYLKSYRQMACACGQILTDGSTNYGAGPVIMDIKSTRFNYGMNVDLVNNTVDLGNYPDDNENSFDVSATFVGTVAAAGVVYQFQIIWEAPGVSVPLAVAYAVTESTPTNPLTNMTISTIVNVPAASTGVNKVWCEIRRLSGASNATISVYRLAVARRA